MSHDNLQEREPAIRLHTDRRMPLDVVVMVGNDIVIAKDTARRLTPEEHERIGAVLTDLRLHYGVAPERSEAPIVNPPILNDL